MLDNLSSSKKEPVRELLEENISLNRTNRLLMSGLIGLSALSLLSINSCSKNASALNQSRIANSSLRDTANGLSAENQKLKDYVEDAQEFAANIREPYPDLMDGKSDQEELIEEKKYQQAKKKFDDACQVLGINSKVLERLQNGIE